VRQWLKESSLKWPVRLLYHRTGLVERYLGWLQEQGGIAWNPLAELRLHYGPRTTPIVRALVCEDSETALQILRRLPPPFGSFLGPLTPVRADKRGFRTKLLKSRQNYSLRHCVR
jgi:hypothetical protein